MANPELSELSWVDEHMAALIVFSICIVISIVVFIIGNTHYCSFCDSYKFVTKLRHVGKYVPEEYCEVSACCKCVDEGNLITRHSEYIRVYDDNLQFSHRVSYKDIYNGDDRPQLSRPLG